MTYANISGWGKCLPPATLTNDDLATFLDTDDKWITTRTGMKERRVSHVTVSELAHIACERALACAGKTAEDVDLIVFGSCTFDEFCPNAASNVQRLLGANNAGCMDLNTACTSGMYSFSVANSMIKSGAVKSALVIGAEVISPLMDWSNRDVAVLFGDGAAAFYLEATDSDSDQEYGILSETLGCYGESRKILSIEGWGTKYFNKTRRLIDIDWVFQGQDIFKRAVEGMSNACIKTLTKAGIESDLIDLVVPHQANVRIINTLTKRLKLPQEKVFLNIERYGNMSAATALVALVEAIEEGAVKPNNLIMMPAFGGGLTWSAHIIRWGDRCDPIAISDAELPETNKTGLDIVNEYREMK